MEAGCRTGHLTYSWLPPVRHPPKRLVTNDEDATGESLKHERDRPWWWQRFRYSRVLCNLQSDIYTLCTIFILVHIKTCDLIYILGKYIDEQSYKLLLLQNQIRRWSWSTSKADKRSSRPMRLTWIYKNLFQFPILNIRYLIWWSKRETDWQNTITD